MTYATLQYRTSCLRRLVCEREVKIDYLSGHATCPAAAREGARVKCYKGRDLCYATCNGTGVLINEYTGETGC